MVRLLPFERAFLPFVDKADCEHTEERHHRPETEKADFGKRYCPRKEKGDFEIENDEQYGYQIKPDVELAAGIVERIEAAFIGGDLFWIRTLSGHDVGRHKRSDRNPCRDPKKNQDREIFAQHILHQIAPDCIRNHLVAAKIRARLTVRLTSG